MLPKQIPNRFERCRARFAGGPSFTCWPLLPSQLAPAENTTTRSIVILFWSLPPQVFRIQFFQRRKGAKPDRGGISGAEQTVNDEPVLKEPDAGPAATLKTASGNKFRLSV